MDGIAARLFLRKDAMNTRVVLVSSATRGEGKTTLATHLARRLGRTGAHTLLVDFDFGKPSLHTVFAIPNETGLNEVLRGQCDLDKVVQPTDMDNLCVLTTGRRRPDSLSMLANGAAAALFEKARAEFEFVVVNGSPILPVVDARLASQHVDMVVMAVRRDVSQTPKVLAACELLGAFGVRKCVAVLIGGDHEVYYYDDRERIVDVRPQEG